MNRGGAEKFLFMTTLQIKNDFHHLIDHLNDDDLLLKFYDLMSRKVHSVDGTLWNHLTREEQEEL
jgi:hypothetical protein